MPGSGPITGGESVCFALTPVSRFWFGSRVQRPFRVLMGAVVVTLLAGGGYLVHAQAAGSGGPGLTTTVGAAGARRVGIGSALMAVQPPVAKPARSGTPKTTPSTSATPKPAPSTPKPTGTPKPPKPTPKPSKPAPPANQSMVDQLLAQINGLRAQHGLAAYSLLSGLNSSAHKHNLRMMGTCGMSHQCPGEASLGSRITAEGVHWNACGENIGWSGPHPNTASAMTGAAEGLTTSMYNETPPDDGHRRNLLSTQFHHVGIDVTRDSSGKVWLTQDFSS